MTIMKAAASVALAQVAVYKSYPVHSSSPNSWSKKTDTGEWVGRYAAGGREYSTLGEAQFASVCHNLKNAFKGNDLGPPTVLKYGLNTTTNQRSIVPIEERVTISNTHGLFGANLRLVRDISKHMKK